MKALAIAAALLLASATTATAQIYQFVNQGTSMIQTALTAGLRYRGMADVSYMAGVGNRRADLLEITTTQGVKYSNWFFMGIGAGVDVMFAHAPQSEWLESNSNKSLVSTSAVIPLYSDFRFNIGGETSTSMFIDVRVGAAFLVGKDYVQVGNGYLNRSECFYLKPTVGMRVPMSATNPKQALNVGASYSLITTDYWGQSAKNISLNGLGVSIGYEW